MKSARFVLLWRKS